MFYFRASRAVNLNTSIHYQMVIIMLGAVDVAQSVEGLPTIQGVLTLIPKITETGCSGECL